MEEIVSKKKVVPVRNRNKGTTCYTLEDGMKRVFAPGQTRNIDIDELKELSMSPGGEYALKNFFIVKDRTALEALEIETEPEYFYTEAEIKKLLTTGSLDQLEDCLNFAPDGVIEIVKSMSVEMELPDTRKRELITKKTGFNIENAINVNRILNEETDDSSEKNQKPERKAKAIETVDSAPSRKAEPVTASKYKILEK